MLLSKNQDRTDVNDDFINKCFLSMDKDFLILLNLSQEDLSSRKNFEKYLIQAGAKTKLRAKALNIYSLKRQHKSQEELLEVFVEISSIDEIKEQGALRYKKLYSYVKAVENVSEANPMRNFIELAIALRTKNDEWVRRASQKILSTSSLQFATFLDPRKISKKLFIQYIDGLFDTFKYMKENFKDPMLLRMLATKMSMFLPMKYKTRFILDFDANWSLSELREVVISREYGQSAIGLWFNVLENRTTETEVNHFLNNVLERRALKKFPKEEFWILKYFYPGDYRRSVLESRLALFVKNKKSVHEDFIMSEILESEAIQKSLSKTDPKLGRALFKVKRDIYKSALKSGHPSQFALYNLFLLGEKDPELFWWFVL